MEPGEFTVDFGRGRAGHIHLHAEDGPVISMERWRRFRAILRDMEKKDHENVQRMFETSWIASKHLYRQRYLLCIEHEGDKGMPWLTYPNAKTTSVQTIIENAFTEVLHRPVISKSFTSGTLIANGVHSLSSTCHVDTERVSPRDPVTVLQPLAQDEMKHALNGHLCRMLKGKGKIRVKYVKSVSHDFHARHDAKSRTFLYRIVTNSTSLLEERQCWVVHEALDLRAMQSAATVLQGTHDFSAFSDAGVPEDSEDDVDPHKTVCIPEDSEDDVDPYKTVLECKVDSISGLTSLCPQLHQDKTSECFLIRIRAKSLCHG